MAHRILFSLFLAGLVILNACGNHKNQSGSMSDKTSSATSTLTAQDLSTASLKGTFNIVQKAVKQGIDVNTADERGRTALMLASYNGHTKIARYLLKHGAHVDSRNAVGRTSLMFASSGPFPGTVKLLLEHHADPNVTDNAEGWSALMFAAAEGQLKVAQILLDHGADASFKDKDGDKAINFAKDNKHTDVVNLLESH